MQVYKDMKSELAIMTKPKDPNVLVVYGVYVFRPAEGGGGARRPSSVLGTFAGRRRRRSCCSSPICGTARHATSSTIGSAESRSRYLSRCIASSLHRIVGQRRSWVLRMAIAAAGFGGAVYSARGCERTPGTAWPQGAPALSIAGTLA